jgi:hypothetical protein
MENVAGGRTQDWMALARHCETRDVVAFARAPRMVLFRLYYLGLAPYENARHFLGLSERSWVNWTEKVRHRCGKELRRRGMFPPRKYFCEAA